MRGFRSNAQGYAGISPRLSGPSMPEPEPAKGPGRPGDQGLPGSTRWGAPTRRRGLMGARSIPLETGIVSHLSTR
jgi:hypothetical protein